MKRFFVILSVILFLQSCGKVYVDGGVAPLKFDCRDVTVPFNIAPLIFDLDGHTGGVLIYIESNGKTYRFRNRVGVRKWHRILDEAADSDIVVTLYAENGDDGVKYDPFVIHVSGSAIDPYIAYRLIEPGYENWNRMGLYQRNLENFRQTPIVENKMTGYGCVNCHSFQSYNPSRFLFHSRVECGGTYIWDGNNLEKLDTKTPQTISALVYPQWHPTEDYVAFSVNSTKQLFHTTDPNRVEVFDYMSDIVVYNVREHRLVSCPELKSTSAFETFPAFSPEGDRIFFCSADSLDMPDNYDKVRYSLCAIDFNARTETFGNVVDTLYNGRIEGKSVSFPRVSPDGRKLVFTVSGYGNFSIWHKDADLYAVDLESLEVERLAELDSDDVESYHSWSSNGRWLIFSSRRQDKLYTRLYVSYCDENGRFSKPFILPQKCSEYYDDLLKSYNIPEFISGKVSLPPRILHRTASEGTSTGISW